MINGKRIALVMPAYDAEETLAATVRELTDLVDTRIPVDDRSSDGTLELARSLGLEIPRDQCRSVSITASASTWCSRRRALVQEQGPRC